MPLGSPSPEAWRGFSDSFRSTASLLFIFSSVSIFLSIYVPGPIFLFIIGVPCPSLEFVFLRIPFFVWPGEPSGELAFSTTGFVFPFLTVLEELEELRDTGVEGCSSAGCPDISFEFASSLWLLLLTEDGVDVPTGTIFSEILTNRSPLGIDWVNNDSIFLFVFLV